MKTSELREIAGATNVTGRVQDLAAEVIRLREGLAKAVRYFPTDTDLAEAGYDGEFIDAACAAYEKANALLTEHDEA